MPKIDVLEAIAYLALGNSQSDKGYTPQRRLELIGSLAQEALQSEYKAPEGPNYATQYGAS